MSAERAERLTMYERLELVLAQEAHSQQRFKPLEEALATKHTPDDAIREAKTFTSMSVMELNRSLTDWATRTFMKKPQHRTKESQS